MRDNPLHQGTAQPNAAHIGHRFASTNVATHYCGDGGALGGKSANFAQRLANCIFWTRWKITRGKLASYQDLQMLRRSSRYLCDRPQRFLCIIAVEQTIHTDFIQRTLLHLGVSCGQIAFEYGGDAHSENIWLLVNQHC